MSKLAAYSAAEQELIKKIMCKLVEGQIETKTIECTDEAIKAAMPQALSDAIALFHASNEYLCG